MQGREQVETSGRRGVNRSVTSLVLKVTTYPLKPIPVGGTDGVRPVMRWWDSNSLDSDVCTPLDRACEAKAPSYRRDAGIGLTEEDPGESEASIEGGSLSRGHPGRRVPSQGYSGLGLRLPVRSPSLRSWRLSRESVQSLRESLWVTAKKQAVGAPGLLQLHESVFPQAG